MEPVSFNHQVKELMKGNEIFSEERISRHLFHIRQLQNFSYSSRQAQTLSALPPKINPLLRQRFFFLIIPISSQQSAAMPGNLFPLPFPDRNMYQVTECSAKQEYTLTSFMVNTFSSFMADSSQIVHQFPGDETYHLEPSFFL